jgi:hypothetical protein
MNYKIKYKQGLVNTSTHPVIKKGQVVEIMEEDGEFYKVRVFITGKAEKIEKKFVITN